MRQPERQIISCSEPNDFSVAPVDDGEFCKVPSIEPSVARDEPAASAMCVRPDEKIGDQARSRSTLPSILAPLHAGHIRTLAIERIERNVRGAKRPLHEVRVGEGSAQLRPHDRADDELPECRGCAKGAERRGSTNRIVRQDVEEGRAIDRGDQRRSS